MCPTNHEIRAQTKELTEHRIYLANSEVRSEQTDVLQTLDIEHLECDCGATFDTWDEAEAHVEEEADR